MSNYTKTTDFEAKDSLPTGDSGKIIRGAEFETEFDAISTAIATKADTAGPTFTGTLTFETISDGTIGVTAFVDEDDMSSDSATLVPTQQSVKAYVDSQVTAQDLDFQADTGGALSIDLDSETLTFTGGTGIDTSGSGNAVTFAIDSTVATLTGTQTLTNKTLTSPDVNTPDIDGGTIDGTVIGGTTAAAGSFTTVSATGNITVDGTVDGRDVATDGTKLDTVETNADVTDTANVTAAGALMDSELTSEASVKALNQGVATTDSPTFAGVTVNGTVEFDGLSGTGSVNVTDILDQDDMSSNSATALATQQSIKAYVDSQVATADTLSEVLANGNTTGGTDILFGDNDKAIFGASGDLQIYHDGSNSYIKDLGTGDLLLSGNTGVQIQSDAGENMITTAANGAVSLFYDASTKLATTSTGIDVTGSVTAEDLIADTTRPEIFLKHEGTQLGGLRADALSKLELKTTASYPIFIQTNGTNVANFAVGGDVSFYNSTGTSQSLFWDASAERLGIGTTSPATALDVTGTANADKITTDSNVDAASFTSTGSTYVDLSNGTVTGRLQTISSDFFIGTATTGTSLAFKSGNGVERLRINSIGDISFYEDTGTTAKLFWDASAESLGIGTSSPSGLLHIASTGASNIKLEDTDNGFAATELNIENGGRDFKITTPQDTIFVQGSTEAMRILDGGNVGIGTSSPARKLHVVGTSRPALIGSDNAVNYLKLYNSATGSSTYNGLDLLVNSTSSSQINTYGMPLTFGTSASNGTNVTERMRIDSSGNVGIGTSSPSALLDVSGATPTIRAVGTSASNPSLTLSSAGITAWSQTVSGSDSSLSFNKDGSEKMRIDSSGNVGINQSSPTRKLHVTSAGSGTVAVFGDSAYNNTVEVTRTTTNASYIGLSATSAVGGIIAGPTFTFSTCNSGGGAVNERMRIDSSGNLLVGKTSVGLASTGFQALASGNQSAFVSDGDRALILNRQTSDGDILEFRKDGTTVGSIGTANGNAFILSNDVGLTFAGGNDAIFPTTSAGAYRDAAIDLGGSGQRFKDLYLSSSIKLSNSSYDTGSTVTTSVSGDLITGLADTALRFYDAGDAIIPRSTADAARDGTTDLGASNSRFKNLYLSGNSNVGNYVYFGGGTNYYVHSDNNYYLRFGTAGSERARIDSSGNLLVGTTDTTPYNNSANTTADRGIALLANGFISAAAYQQSALDINRTGNDGNVANFYRSGSVVGNISVTTSATAYNTSSDQRLKDNIIDAPSASDDIDAIQVRSFDWKADGSHQKYGMVAQELQSVAPEAVTGDANSDDMMGVDYSKLVPMLVKEIQSLRARVAQLEGEN